MWLEILEMLWSMMRLIFKTSSVTPDFFYVFNLILSFFTCSESFEKICVWELLGANVLQDVRAHCYCASLVRTLFIRHARATSFSSACTKSKTQQNTELMTFALTRCANIFVGCSVTPTFFRQITSFSDSFHYAKKQKKSVRGKF